MEKKNENNGKENEKENNENNEMNEQEFKENLSTEEYKVLREKGTEPAFSGKLLHNKEKGAYVCKACGTILFKSETKFDSSCGWPSFYDAEKGSVEFKEDKSHGMNRIEVLCKKCKSHLGHVFDDGPNPTGKRYCINSIALGFEKEKEKENK